ncbi:MAG: transcription factor [Candidatus Nezhaarchaeota archaeon]|nr:transcription factor [Candidatus Nezhaarchaeota archaeon]MCX8142001.1 transcription factor [Candidatus Nezhaarchaeota archaeon]MDW8050218.1 transcription factor [Nitrososphaerota archaeon]
MESETTAHYDKESIDILLKLTAELCGEDAVKVVRVLLNEGEASDEVLAEKSGMRLNQVRRILYDLLDKQLIVYNRHVDKDRGYYVYKWSLNREGLRDVVKERKRLILNILHERLKYEEQNMFFVCPNSCAKRVIFAKALEQQFKCPLCGAILQSFDNSKILRKLRSKIEVLEKDLGLRR